MKKVLGTCLVSSMLLIGCSDSDKKDEHAVSAPPQPTLSQPQGQWPTSATRQNQAADVKQLDSTQMQNMQQMETQVRGMLNQVQSNQQNGGQLSQQQLLQMQQQVQQMMNQLQTGEVPAQAPAAPSQQTAPSPKPEPELKPESKPASKPEPQSKSQSKQQKPNVQYSKKYTYRGQPLTLEQERKWDAYLKQQVIQAQARARNRALNQASRAVQQAGSRVSRQIDYNSMRNACHIANNCRVVRER